MSDSTDELIKELRQLNKEQRRAYVERYSQEKVELACNKSSRHKSRAKKWGCTNHFTAWEWLDLLQAHDFRCIYCREVVPLTLEPHHVAELHTGGTNTIDNILPICRRCHLYLHHSLYPDDVTELWMADQQKLLEFFYEGDRVKKHGRYGSLSNPPFVEHKKVYATTSPICKVGARQVGVVMLLFPAKRGLIPLRGHIYKSGGMSSYSTAFGDCDYEWAWMLWQEGAAKALVHWLRTIKGVPVAVGHSIDDLRYLKKVEDTSEKKT